jgi:DeoR/GlpR family transcriptional regulator of sugar metabolism
MTWLETHSRQIRRKRIAKILEDLSKRGEVHVNDYVAQWLSSRSYIRDLFRTIRLAYDFVELDESGDVLRLKGTITPTGEVQK